MQETPTINPKTGNAGHRKTNGYNSSKLRAKQNKKRKDAENRQFTYDGLTVKQKLAQVHNRPGESKREVAKIMKNAPVEVAPVAKVAPVKKTVKKVAKKVVPAAA